MTHQYKYEKPHKAPLLELVCIYAALGGGMCIWCVHELACVLVCECVCVCVYLNIEGEVSAVGILKSQW